jgi:hypothetical protein
MKHFLSIIAVLLLLTGCERGVKIIVWDKFPEERVKSYLGDYKKGDTIRFVSENSDTVFYNLIACGLNSTYVYSEKKYASQSGEWVDLDMFDGDIRYRFLFSGDIINRHTVIFACNIVVPSGLVSASFVAKNEDVDENYFPYNENLIFSYLTDTITMKNSKNTNIACTLVAGKGISWFADTDGVKWTLQE